MKTKELYVKVINMKMYLCLYFAASVFLYGAICIYCGFKEIKIITLFEMVIGSLVVALLQLLLLPDNIDLTRRLFFRNSILWLILSFIIFFIISYWGEWFIQMPSYSIYIFSICAGIGFLAMLIGLRFIQEADTIRLNHALQDYQEK